MTRLQKTATLILAIALAVLTLFAVGCKKSSNPVESTVIPITTDIFPLTVGHRITYTGYLRPMGSDTNITTGTTYSSSWTVVSNDTATPLGGTSNLIIDSITAPVSLGNSFSTSCATPQPASQIFHSSKLKQLHRAIHSPGFWSATSATALPLSGRRSTIRRPSAIHPTI